MVRRLVNLGNGFWNIRCTMKLAGIINIGTHVSIVRLRTGRFVFLDSYPLNGEVRDQLLGLTKGGALVEAVLNLHPFHTLHCEAMARDFPKAKFYGSERHRHVCPGVPWEADRVESKAVVEKYSSDLQFAVPPGIEYIPIEENVRASSLLAFHPASGSLHVDDTLNVLPLPAALRHKLPRLVLHPSLKSALKADRLAAEAFCGWLEATGDMWHGVKTVCAAHNGVARFAEGEFADTLRGLAASLRQRPVA